MNPAADRPTNVRFVVVLLATMVAVLLYLDRICLSIAERYVREDLGLAEWQMGVLLSAFFWAYALGQIPAGWLSDRYGARIMLSLYVFTWSAFTGLMGVAEGFIALLLLRFGCGLTEAGAYPTSASLLSRWVPFGRRGLASGVVSLGGRMGGGIAPLLTAFLMVWYVGPQAPSVLTEHDLLDPAGAAAPEGGDNGRAVRERYLTGETGDAAALTARLNDAVRDPSLVKSIDTTSLGLGSEAKRLLATPEGEMTPPQVERRNRLILEAVFPKAIRKVYGPGWRPVMILYGVAGIGVALVFWMFFRDSPRQHPGVNDAERALIEEGRPVLVPGSVGAPPIGAMAADFSLWMASLAQFMTNVGWIFLLTWMPRYLAEVHHVGLEQRGLMQSLPIFVGMIAQVMGGWLTDRVTARMGLRWGRSLPVAFSRLVVMAAFLGCLVVESPWAATALLVAVGFFTDLGNPSAWAYAQDVGGRHVGAVLGWANMWGNLGAAVSPIVLERVIAWYGWNAMFLTCAGAFLIGGLAGFGIDASKPIVKERPAEA
jgi:ACS family glucarate transporter-like MFS transporter